MATEIISNGPGKKLPVKALLATLKGYPLDRQFEGYGNFIEADERRPGATSFFGNFLTISHVFNITTDDPKLVKHLTTAIRDNQARLDYLAQPTFEEVKAEIEAKRLARDAIRMEEARRKALAVLGAQQAAK